jgi:integrase/recombinase XerD
MHEQLRDGLTLFSQSGSRKYLNAVERKRLLESAQGFPPSERLFCLTLAWSGARISEILALTPAVIDIEAGVVSIEILKRRKRGIVRQVPSPDDLLRDLARIFRLRRRQRNPRLAIERLWRWSRTTAWRHIKAIMWEAGIIGAPAMRKGLRHAFGVGERPAASGATLARSRVVAHDRHLRRCPRSRRGRVCRVHVRRFACAVLLHLLQPVIEACPLMLCREHLAESRSQPARKGQRRCRA